MSVSLSLYLSIFNTHADHVSGFVVTAYPYVMPVCVNLCIQTRNVLLCECPGFWSTDRDYTIAPLFTADFVGLVRSDRL